MDTSRRIDTFEESRPEFRGAGIWFVAVAIAFIVAGTMAILAPLVAGLAVTALVAWLLLVGGVMHAVNAFTTDSITRAVWHALVGMFYVIAGLYCLAHPLIALGTLTIALACMLFFESLMNLIAWFATRREDGAAWLLLDTMATMFVSVLIWAHWPSVSVWAIGTLVGVKLLISGISRLMLRPRARPFVEGRSIS